MVSWHSRNTIIANLIPKGATVLDLGAGDLDLLSQLKSIGGYRGYDKKPQYPIVFEWDFNQSVPDEHYDYTIVSGVLEYIDSPRKFIKNISKLGGKIILTYSPADGQQIEDREKSGWVNHLSLAELETIFEQSGLKYKICDYWNEQIVFELNKKGAE